MPRMPNTHLLVLSHPVGGACERFLSVCPEERGSELAEVDVTITEGYAGAHVCMFVTLCNRKRAYTGQVCDKLLAVELFEQWGDGLIGRPDVEGPQPSLRHTKVVGEQKNELSLFNCEEDNRFGLVVVCVFSCYLVSPSLDLEFAQHDFALRLQVKVSVWWYRVSLMGGDFYTKWALISYSSQTSPSSRNTGICVHAKNNPVPRLPFTLRYRVHAPRSCPFCARKFWNCFVGTQRITLQVVNTISSWVHARMHGRADHCESTNPHNQTLRLQRQVHSRFDGVVPLREKPFQMYT